MITEEPLEHSANVRDDYVDVETRRQQHLLPAEGEQLPRQCGGATGRLNDLFSVTSQRTGGKTVPQKLGVSADDRQQVVEVVRNPAGEQADRFHLLRLSDLGLEQLALGDVEADVDDADRAAPSGLRAIVGATLQPARTAIGPDRSEFGGQVAGAVPNRRCELLSQGRTVLGMDERMQNASAVPANESGAMPKSAAVLSDQTTRPVSRSVSPIPMPAAVSAEIHPLLDAGALSDLLLESRDVPCVLISQARLPRKGNGHPFVSLGEVVGAQLVCEAQPSIDPGRRGDRHAEVRELLR